jgi:teichuronic acid biosynthesis glycosyltransferase TuaG
MRMSSGRPTVSVIISTYRRPDTCERALRSALDQTEPPLEVLVCDDCSGDDTEQRIRAWERNDPRVRYLSTGRNAGTPAGPRNLGLRQARGEWVAFLDDDDQWLPDKLANQLIAGDVSRADLIAANALRSDGSSYFHDAHATSYPTRVDVVRANPIITSSVLVRRDLMLAAGGFRTGSWLRGVEDYAAWLDLAALDARFVVLGAPLLHYTDESSDRLSLTRVRNQAVVASVIWVHTLRTSPRSATFRAAIRHSLGIGYVLGEEVWRSRRRIAFRSASKPA